jgi:hypothetical protein
MPPHQKMPTIGVTHQRGDTSLVDANFDGFEPAYSLMGNCARVFFVAYADVAAEFPDPRKPSDEQDRGD